MRQIKLIIAALLVFSPFAASADPILEGMEPDYHGSFTASVGYSGWDAIATIEAFLVSESGQGPFQAPGFETEGVDAVLVNALYALWNGASDGNGTLNFFLDGDATGDMVIDLLVYAADGTFMTLGQGDPYQGFSGRTSWTDGFFMGIEYFAADHDLNQYDRRAAIPEPGTLALLGLGLVGLAARRRRKV